MNVLTAIGETLLLAVLATALLRIGGRKAVSQMTIPQLGILLALGPVLGADVSGKGLGVTAVAASTFVAFLMACEWISLKWDRAETALKGKAVPVIADGQLLLDNLRKLRVSVDDLEKRLRLAGISAMADVKHATLETNGELGYELMRHARPVTMGDLERMLRAYVPLAAAPPAKDAPLFREVSDGEHEQAVPSRLQ